MLNSLDPGSESFLASVDRIQQAIAEANRQVTSGKRISVAADSPDQIGLLLQLRASRQHNTEVQTNLGLAQTDAQSADAALSSAIKLMDRAVVLASMGGNAPESADSRQMMAEEVQALQEQMVSYSQTTVSGRYIFNGAQADSPAYTFDSSLLDSNPVVQQSTALAAYRVEDPAGGSFDADKNAQEIFDAQNADGPTADNVFDSLNQLRLALLGGDTDTIAAAGGAVKQASSYLNSIQAFYGRVESKLQIATDFAANYDVRLQTQLSQIEDADAVGAALQLTQATTQLQAAMQMRARMPHSSLFDFLG